MAKCGEDRTLLTVSDQNCSLICLDLLGHTDLLEKQVYAVTWSPEMVCIEL